MFFHLIFTNHRPAGEGELNSYSFLPLRPTSQGNTCTIAVERSTLHIASDWTRIVTLQSLSTSPYPLRYSLMGRIERNLLGTMQKKGVHMKNKDVKGQALTNTKRDSVFWIISDTALDFKMCSF